ncbi:helix-turn-helix domain-containing protein [Streptomyces sp. MH13]|uniref:helix-turn-helix domain-containing protein n=1 Tax=Streptomyces sp. MH13 TaxID=3417651 RepID=UPI003CEE803D
MAPRSAPTERQRRLGAEMRKMRMAAGMTTEFAAGLLGVPRTNIPNMESGRSGISPDRVRTLARNYGCSDEAYVNTLVSMTAGRSKGWWEAYRGVLPDSLLDVSELEWHARGLRLALCVHLPGLLQTEGHARALFKLVIPRLSDAEVDVRVAHRMERQRILDRDNPAPLGVIVHEAALRMEFGGSSVARAQLEKLLRLSEREHITLRVVPFKAGGFPGAGQSVVYAESGVPQLDTVELDSAHGAEFMDDEEQLANYRALFDAVESMALPSGESCDLVHSIIRQL